MPHPRSVRQPRRLVEAVIRPIQVDVPDSEDEEDVPIVDPAPAAHVPRRELPSIQVANLELLGDLSRYIPRCICTPMRYKVRS